VRCAHKRFAELLPHIFLVWQTIPGKGAHESENPRGDIAFYALGHCPPHWMSEAVAQWLISVLPSYPELKAELEHLLARTDAPSAFEYQVRHLAAQKRENEGDLSLYFMIDKRWDLTDKHGYKFSDRSCERLHAIWANALESIEDRECAFRFWLFSATVSDLSILRSIKSGSTLYSLALRKRMKLRDRTTVNELPDELPQNPWLLHDLPAVWTPDFLKMIAAVFQSERKSSYYPDSSTTAFLLSLPGNDAEALLIELWTEWGSEPAFQAAALLLGTNNAKKLVENTLNQPQNCDKVLKLAKFVMGANWPYLNREELLPIWLNRCEPYLHHASQETLRRFIHLCRSPLAWRWYERHVEPLLKPKPQGDWGRRMHLGTMQERFRNISDSYYRAELLFEEAERRGLNKNEILRTIANEARKESTVESVRWLAGCISVAGDRQDISLLQEQFTGVGADALAKARRDCSFAVMRRVLN
jgi:hypothetical protein